MVDYFQRQSYTAGAAQVSGYRIPEWMGDEKLQEFYKRWKVITTGLVTPLADSILCDKLLDRIRPSKKLQADINEFVRFREYDPRKSIRWLTDSIDRLLQRERMLNARALQSNIIQSGVSLTGDTVAWPVATAPEKG